jgi:hypothetical protein
MANLIYTAIQTPILFADSAQAEDATLTLSALATVTGRISAQYDRGAGSLASWYTWELVWSLTGTNVVGAVVEIYAAVTNVSARAPGGLGTSDAALVTAKRNNLALAGFAYVDQTTTNTVMYARGTLWIPGRYVSMGVWNGTTLPFQTSTSLHQLYLTPLADEIQ